MKKAIKGGSRRGKKSTHRDPKGQRVPHCGSADLKPAQVPDTPFLAANEVERYKALKSQYEAIENFSFEDSAKKKRPRNSKKTPTIWEVYYGWVRHENYRPRIALEALDAEARNRMFSNPPVERKYEGLCNILDVMEDTLAFAKNPEQSASVRNDSLALFHFLDNLLIYGLAGVDFITIVTMAFTCGVVATRLRQPEVMKAAHEGDIAHRRSVLGGKNRARPEIHEERLRNFQSLKMKTIDGEWRYPSITSICRVIAVDELKAQGRLSNGAIGGRAKTIEKQLRAKYPNEFPISRGRNASGKTLRS